LRSSVADYEVIRTLPASSSGQSRYLCRPPERLGSDEPVMVTELAVDASSWRDLVARLSVMARSPSPQLLRLLEAGPDHDQAGSGGYLASEAAPAGTAADLGRHEHVTLITAVAAAARGAHALHDAGVAHGAIDARSIVFTAHGPVLAPPSVGGPAGLVVRAKAWRDLVGLDPDLLRGEPPSRSTDLWALAATLHGLLSARPLYPDLHVAGEGEPVVTTMQRVLFTRPAVDPSLPGDLPDILSACFRPDPADRPATAGILADRLSEQLP
jgi:serine/threonine protein kinase